MGANWPVRYTSSGMNCSCACAWAAGLANRVPRLAVAMAAAMAMDLNFMVVS